jgi:predicted enzyme related to lactoylglutathione lyase
MTRAHVLGTTALWIAALSSGCGNAAPPGSAPAAPVAGTGTQTHGVNVAPTGGTAGAAVSGSAGAVGSSAGTAAAVVAGSAAAANGGVGAAAGLGGSAGSSAASAGSSAGSSAAAGGSAGAAGATSGPAAGSGSQDIPKPMSAPQVWGFGIGITDVPAAVKFYMGVMKMSVEKDAIKRDDRTETTLYGTQAMRGARLTLMKFDDMRNTRKITAKLVWQAQNVPAVNTAASMYPDYVSRLNFGIVQFDGPETYIHEVGGSFDAGGAAITVPYPVALGFAVSDQPASRKFYTSLGMTESSLGSFSVTDANGTGTIAEYSLKFTDGMGIVLQQWTPMRNAKDNPVKVTIMVPDAKAMADKISAAGGTIVKPAERSPAYDNRLLVVAKDLDGYVLEIVE